MIRIIRQGKFHNIHFEQKCPFCDCVFTYSYNDYLPIYPTLDGNSNLYVKCPECSFAIDTSEDRRQQFD